MFCKNCGTHLGENDEICQNCGGPRGCGNNHCMHCGAIINGECMFCSSCGAQLNSQEKSNTSETYAHTVGDTKGTYQQNASTLRYDTPGQQKGKPKSRLVAGLLALFVGCFGVHNFYLGNNTTGLIQILVSTIGGFFTCGIATFAIGIWAIVEAIFIFIGKIETDAYGIPLDD